MTRPKTHINQIYNARDSQERRHFRRSSLACNLNVGPLYVAYLALIHHNS
jgi:hypothetical protein